MIHRLLLSVAIYIHYVQASPLYLRVGSVIALVRFLRSRVRLAYRVRVTPTLYTR
jgi:hypothetical protein